jgi:hypothetical protein
MKRVPPELLRQMAAVGVRSRAGDVLRRRGLGVSKKVAEYVSYLGVLYSPPEPWQMLFYMINCEPG